MTFKCPVCVFGGTKKQVKLHMTDAAHNRSDTGATLGAVRLEDEVAEKPAETKREAKSILCSVCQKGFRELAHFEQHVSSVAKCQTQGAVPVKNPRVIDEKKAECIVQTECIAQAARGPPTGPVAGAAAAAASGSGSGSAGANNTKGLKPFLCSVCSKKFVKREHGQQHIESVGACKAEGAVVVQTQQEQGAAAGQGGGRGGGPLALMVLGSQVGGAHASPEPGAESAPGARAAQDAFAKIMQSGSESGWTYALHNQQGGSPLAAPGIQLNNPDLSGPLFAAGGVPVLEPPSALPFPFGSPSVIYVSNTAQAQAALDAAELSLPVLQQEELSLPGSPALLCALSCHATSMGNLPEVGGVGAEAEAGLTRELCLVQIATSSAVVLFDILAMGCVPDALRYLLEHPAVVKLVHDVTGDASQLFLTHQVGFRNVLDTQLVYQLYNEGHPFASFTDFVRQFHCDRKSMEQHVGQLDGAHLWELRPMETHLKQLAMQEVVLLLQCGEGLQQYLESWFPNSVHNPKDAEVQPKTENGVPLKNGWTIVLKASEERFKDAQHHQGEGRRMVFLPTAPGAFVLTSQEFSEQMTGIDGAARGCGPLLIECDYNAIMAVLPPIFGRGNALANPLAHVHLRQIVLELGQRPYAYDQGSKRVFLLGEGVFVKKKDLEDTHARVQPFTANNRAAIANTLHSVSCVRDPQGGVCSLTITVGRSVRGNADVIRDLLQEHAGVSGGCLLLLGPPRTGKTTLLREIACVLSQRLNVCVVDTSNHMCGDGELAHPSVGLSRRVTILDVSKQSQVIYETVNNHAPDVLVVDQLATKADVEAVRFAKQRGVRLIAGVTGDLVALVHNSLLNELVGCATVVDLASASKTKLKTLRQSGSVFESVVELQEERLNQVAVVWSLDDAVQHVLAGRPYLLQSRKRNDEGEMRVKPVVSAPQCLM